MILACRVQACGAWGVIVLVLSMSMRLSAREGCAVCADLHHAVDVDETSGFKVVTFTTGVKKMAIIRVDFEDLPGAPQDAAGVFTPARLLETVNGRVASYFDEISYGKSTVALRSRDITTVLRMPATAESYTQDPLLEKLSVDARQAASEAGYDFDGYHRVAVVASSLAKVARSQVRFRGYAAIGGIRSWFQGDFSAELVAHELGHNYGVGHASSWWVPDGETDPLHASGQKIEYGDTYDIMGVGNFDTEIQPWMGASSLAQLAWLPDTAYETISEDTSLRLYRFDHRDADLQRTLGIRIPLDSNRAYWLSYRKAYGNLSEKLSVVRADEVGRRTLLFDMHPGGTLGDAGLAVGETFSEYDLGLAVKLTGSGGSGADAWVDVSLAFVPEVVFRRADVSVVEDAGSAVLEIERLRAQDIETVVSWTVLGGTAVVGEDVVAASGTVRWSADDSEVKRIEVPLMRDTEDESEESFTVRLTVVEGAVLPVRDAVVHIIEPGVPDPTFETVSFDGRIRQIVPHADGGGYVVGDFERIGAKFGRGVVRMLSSGQVDTRFSVGQGVNEVPVYAALARDQGTLLCGGVFSRYDWDSSPALVRVLPDASRDESFDSPLFGTVFQLVPEASGGYYAVGSFAGGVARFSAAGQLDLTWSTGFPVDSVVTGLVILTDGGVLVVGRFPQDNAAPSWGLVKLDATGKQTAWWGTLEAEEATILKLRKAGDSVLLIGDFQSYDETPFPGLVMLSEEGVVDEPFHEQLGAGPNGVVADALAESEGSWILVGDFDQVNDVTRNGVARLAADGSLDSWDPGSRLPEQTGWDDFQGTALAQQADGNLLLGLANEDASEGRLARVASAVLDGPGLLEMEATALTAQHGNEIVLPIVRRRGDVGDVSVSYGITSTSSAEDAIYASLTGRLAWTDGDSQPRGIHLVMPSDPRVSHVTVSLRNAGGGAQTTRQDVALITLEEAPPSAVWLYAHFGSAANVASAFAAEVDVDQDGISNLIEYALDRNPHDSDRAELTAYPRVRVSQIGPSAEQSLEIELDLPAVLRPDIRYEILMGDGINEPERLAHHDGAPAGWVMAEGVSPPYVAPLAEGTRQQVRFREPITELGSLRRFMQLRVQLLR